MSSLANEFLEKIKPLENISPEVKNLMVEILIYEKKIEDGSQQYAYKVRLNEIIESAVKERLKNEDKNKTA